MSDDTNYNNSNDYSLSKNEKYCPHCSKVLGRSTFYQHKMLYFFNGTWKVKETSDVSSERNEGQSSLFTGVCMEEVNDEEVIEPSESACSDIPDEDDELDIDDNPEIWMSDEEPDNDFVEMQEIEDDDEPSHQLSQVISILTHLLFAWQMTFNLSDRCLECLFKLFIFFLQMIQLLVNSCEFERFIQTFPSTLFQAKHLLGFNSDEFIKFVCCPKCNKLYKYEEATFIDRRGTKQTQACDFIKFPNHTQQRMRDPCGTLLMKRVVSIDGSKHHFYPFKVYTYQPLKSSLERLISRENILEDLKRKRTSNTDALYDVYDGNIWKELLDHEGNPYFQDVRNLGGMINVDWFQPFDNSEHSVGVIYMVILNLSREIRFKRENVIIVGVIPGPREPELVINSFLKPYVEELLLFWKGVYLKENKDKTLYRFALLCASSDLPATRKCCGFLSYNALKGCSKCFKEFPRDEGNRPDYSGYDFESWEKRTAEEHRHAALLTQQAVTLTSKSDLESASGVRYSELLRLPYFDPIRGHLVDPMHNLLLGTAKHTFSIWLQKAIITDDKIKKIDTLMKELTVASEIGRITKSMFHYKTMKSDEWKNWVIHYSLFCLKDVIGKQHYNMWQVFVRACKLLINTSISNEEAVLAHQLLLLFCNLFQRILGHDSCTPNMHMHLHLLSCVQEYGPIYGFWCYSFERYNGILGSYNTNNHALTITLMRKFITGIRTVASYQTNIHVEGLPRLSDFNLLCDQSLSLNVSSLDRIRRNHTDDYQSQESLYKLITVGKLECLTSHEIQATVEMFSSLGYTINVGKFIRSYNKIQLGREVLSTSKKRAGNSRDHYVLCKEIMTNDIIPGIIDSIFVVDVKLKRDTEHHYSNLQLAFIKLRHFQPYPQRHWFGVNCPMQLWSTSFEEVKIIPLHYIYRKCSIAKGKQNFDRLELANGKRSRVTASDIVYYVL